MLDLYPEQTSVTKIFQSKAWRCWNSSIWRAWPDEGVARVTPRVSQSHNAPVPVPAITLYPQVRVISTVWVITHGISQHQGRNQVRGLSSNAEHYPFTVPTPYTTERTSGERVRYMWVLNVRDSTVVLS